jgi:flagellar biosynthesis/type III secretory pathway ATPase
VSPPGALLAQASEAIREADLARRHGFVTNLIGLIIEATGLQAEVGEVCLVGTDRNREAVSAEVVGFREGRTLLMPLGELHGIGPGTRVLASGAPFRITVGDSLLGRIVDGLGIPEDGRLASEAAAGESGIGPRGRASVSASASACARWTASCRADAASASASSPARGSASPR